MRPTRIRQSQRNALLGVLALLALGATSVEAQLAIRRSDERVLFLIPSPGNGTDTSFVVSLADEHHFVPSHLGDDIVDRGGLSSAREHPVFARHVLAVPDSGRGVLGTGREGDHQNERQSRGDHLGVHARMISPAPADGEMCPGAARVHRTPRR